LLSDAHLELGQPDEPAYTYDFPVMAEDVALLGDMGHTISDGLFEWFDVQLTRFRRVFYLAGNHEAYEWSLEESHKRLQDYAAPRAEPSNGRGVFIYLYRTRYDLSPTLTLLGCTLWSELDPKHAEAISRVSPDFKRIKGFHIPEYESVHQVELSWLEDALSSLRTQEPDRQIVIFTHHSPTFENTSDPKFKGGFAGSAFSTKLTEKGWWGEQVKTWCFGHTHWSCDFERKGVRVVSNQKGYPTDPPQPFDPCKIIEVRKVEGMRYLAHL
ncbi:hypothetical protein DACRYDRAFT_55626, partial [Dacryopinax primogenitus]